MSSELLRSVRAPSMSQRLKAGVVFAILCLFANPAWANCQFPGVPGLDFAAWGEQAESQEGNPGISFVLKRVPWTLGLDPDSPAPGAYYRDLAPAGRPGVLGPGFTGDALRILADQAGAKFQVLHSPEGLGLLDKVRVSGVFWDDFELVSRFSDTEVSVRLNGDIIEATASKQWEISWSRLESGVFLGYFLENFLETPLYRDLESKTYSFMGSEKTIRQVSKELDLFAGMSLVPVSGSLWKVKNADFEDLVRVLGDADLFWGKDLLFARTRDFAPGLQVLDAELVDSGNLVFPILAGTGLHLGPICEVEDMFSLFSNSKELVFGWGSREVALDFMPGKEEQKFFGSPFLVARSAKSSSENPELLVLAFSGFERK